MKLVRNADPLEGWLARCRELALEELDGIEDAAQALAILAAGDRELMERARRRILAELERQPGDPTLTEMLSFWRRAFEKGDWEWESGSLDVSKYL